MFTADHVILTIYEILIYVDQHGGCINGHQCREISLPVVNDMVFFVSDSGEVVSESVWESRRNDSGAGRRHRGFLTGSVGDYTGLTGVSGSGVDGLPFKHELASAHVDIDLVAESLICIVSLGRQECGRIRVEYLEIILEIRRISSRSILESGSKGVRLHLLFLLVF